MHSSFFKRHCSQLFSVDQVLAAPGLGSGACIGLGMLMLLIANGLGGTVCAQTALAETATVRVIRFSEPEVLGQLVTATIDGIVLQTDAGLVETKSNDISRIDFQKNLPNPTLRGSVEITLTDGSKLRGSKLIGKDQSWKLVRSEGGTVAIDNSAVRAALFRDLPPALNKSWQENIAETKDADALVVLRPGGALDRIGGFVLEVKETQVVFDLDGQPSEIPIEKVAGIVWFRRGLDRIRPTVEITASDDSVWFAESFQWTISGIELKTQLGQTVNLPSESITSINYASANIRWIADESPIEAAADRRVDWKSQIPGLATALKPKFITVKSDGTSSDVGSDLDLHFTNPGKYSVRVPDGFSSLQSTIERTGNGTQRSDLSIEIWQDDERLWQALLPANQESLKLDVRVVAGKKVRLIVASSSKLMIGTEVLWKQPRFKR